MSVTSSNHLIGLQEEGSGTFRPRIFAVFKLMTRSSIVDCSTGREAGGVPRRQEHVAICRVNCRTLVGAPPWLAP
jgi:hypothetical protein